MGGIKKTGVPTVMRVVVSGYNNGTVSGNIHRIHCLLPWGSPWVQYNIKLTNTGRL